MNSTPNPEPTGVAPRTQQTPRLAFALIYGGLSFGLVSVLAYSIWAFRLVRGAAAMFSSIAVVYLVLGGLALSRLVSASEARKRFPLWFALAFLIYALGWCLFWFGLKGKMQADLWGAVAGLAGMTLLWQRLYGRPGDFLRLFAGLFVLHCAGYYLGGVFHARFHGPPGMLLWGVAHGVGFGAGIGYVLWRCQASVKMQLPSTPPA